MRRLLIGAIAVLLLVLVVGVFSARHGDTSQANTVGETVCPTSTSNQIAAQSVPSATLVPCIALFGGRWSVTSETFTDDGTSVAMTGDDASDVSWKVDFAASCDLSWTTTVREPSAFGDVEGVTVSQRETESDSSYERVQHLSFDGGCVTSSVTMPVRYDRALVLGDVDAALVLVPRVALDAQVREQTDGKLGLDP